MDFLAALRDTFKGKRVRREAWPGGKYIEYDPVSHSVYEKGGDNYTYVVTKADVLATDWLILE